MTRVGENRPQLPKRFYKTAAAIEEGERHAIKLDGRVAKTKGGAPLAISSARLAAAVADEWNAQGDHIDLAAMAMTRFAMTALDLAESDAEGWREATLAFLGSDLLCYRAEEPQSLVERQAAAWDPILNWARNDLGIELEIAAGIVFTAQSDAALARARELLGAMSGERVLGVKSAAEIAGSAVIGLALAHDAFRAEALFDASRVDESFQAERWGLDSEAERRERRLKDDFMNAARYLSLLELA